MRNGNQISKKTRHKNNRQMEAICLYLIIKRRITQTYLLQDKCSDYSSVVGVKRLELPTSCSQIRGIVTCEHRLQHIVVFCLRMSGF